MYVIGTERHESRRIDNQLRGRSGRQGDVGTSQFFVSFEDDLMRRFGSGIDKIKEALIALGMTGDQAIRSKRFTKTIESAQRKVEGNNFDMRKSLLDYDNVMNQQREIIYSQRREVIAADDISEIIKKLYSGILAKIAKEYFASADSIESIDYAAVNAILKNLFGEDNIISKEDIKSLNDEDMLELLRQKVDDIYQMRVDEAKKLNIEDQFNKIAKYLVLNTVNEKWMDHIDAITELKEGIGLRAYAQTNPLQAYKIESYNMFEELNESIREESVKAVFSLRPKRKEEVINVKMTDKITNIATNAAGEDTPKRKPVRVEKKVGRNDPCPCGSGKKYKNCCGKN